MEHPRIANWVAFRKDGQGNRMLVNLLDYSVYPVAHPALWDLARKLDGRHDPFEIAPELTEEEILKFLEALEGQEMLRQGRMLSRGLLELMVTLVEPRKVRAAGLGPFFLDTARVLLWLPVLLVGWYCFLNHDFHTFGGSYWLGLVLGILVGAVLHELSHAASALRWGGYVFEYGFFLKCLVLPGMYVVLQTAPVKRRLRRVMINSAGIEMNFLLSGVFLLLATWFEGQSDALFAAGIGNLILALMNFLPGCGLDGEHMLGELLGSLSAADRAKEVLGSREQQNRLKRRGFSGQVELAACRILALTRMILPMLLVLQIVEVIFLWFNG